uniref:MTSS I-BAR domain containing 2 n=1 Tax=Cairina moschata TaxID=8855 RepID=A0A8C3CGP9_CAIMO
MVAPQWPRTGIGLAGTDLKTPPTLGQPRAGTGFTGMAPGWPPRPLRPVPVPLSLTSRPCDEASEGRGWKGEILGCGGQGKRVVEDGASAQPLLATSPSLSCPCPPGGGCGGAVPEVRGLTAASPLAELLPHLGGLQLQGHQAALPAQDHGAGRGRLPGCLPESGRHGHQHPRGHAGHRLRAHPHVHAAPQHRGQAPAVHQVGAPVASWEPPRGFFFPPPNPHRGVVSAPFPPFLLLRPRCSALMESLITPLQDRIEDWKKAANQLDKDHAKEYKRARHEIKKKSSDTLKLQKKARKGKGDLQPQLDTALQDVNDMYLLLEETEKQAVRRALIEERGRFCTFIAFLQPVVNGELTMLGEITHLQGIIDDLAVLTAEPHKLPPASEQVIKDLKGSDYSWSYQTPPSSPSSSSSRKSSMCSVSSAKGGLPWPGGAQTCSPSSTYRYRSLAQPASAGTRLSSVSSHDSGFISQQEAAYSKPPSPMPSDITSQKSSSSASSEASETCQSVSECSSPTSDWSKASPYDQPAISTLQRRKDRVEHLREAEVGSATGTYPGMGAEDAPRPRMSPATIAAKHGEEVSPAASDLAMVLTRGLSLEHQKSSRDSLQYSSGYSTQTTTPSCSEDTIPSQGSDYDCYSVNGDVECEPQSDFDKSSTIPRNSNIAQNYRRMIQTKRPASTAGLPSGTSLPAGTTPGVATIRRTPSTKPSVRRTLSNAGPIPIRPPIVPVKTPTVPDSPAYAGPTRVGSEECVFYAEDASPGPVDFAKASPKRLSLPNTAWGGGGVAEIPVYPGAAPRGTGAAEEEEDEEEDEEDRQLAANRHSLVEKIGELVAGARALGEGQFPFPTALEETPTPPPAPAMDPPAEDMLVAIRRGVRLRRTVTNDRSAPRIS